MEHSSIQVTVDVYGHLVPGGNRAASIGSMTRNHLQPDAVAVGQRETLSALACVVSRDGIEPSTRRLRVCCSAN